MPRFKIQLYKVPFATNDGPMIEQVARDAREAAEIVCGGVLVGAGQSARLRARVWPTSKPRESERFYLPYDEHWRPGG